jgi:hypothetical protein
MLAGKRRHETWGAKHPCGFYFDAFKTPRENNGLEIEMRKLLLGAAAAAMVAGGSVAQAAPVADVRSGSPVAGAEDLGGGATLWLGLLAAVLLGVALWGINDNDADNDFPVSP